MNLINRIHSHNFLQHPIEATCYPSEEPLRPYYSEKGRARHSFLSAFIYCHEMYHYSTSCCTYNCLLCVFSSSALNYKLSRLHSSLWVRTQKTKLQWIGIEYVNDNLTLIGWTKFPLSLNSTHFLLCAVGEKNQKWFGSRCQRTYNSI